MFLPFPGLVSTVFVACTCFCGMFLIGCDSKGEKSPGGSESPLSSSGAGSEQLPDIPPPFEAKGDLSGLLITWFDADGAHPAKNRDEVPEASRTLVVLKSLQVERAKRLDPEHVWVADVSAVGPDGKYKVRVEKRDAVDEHMDSLRDEAKKREAAIEKALGGDVVLYRTSWCGYCKKAAAFLRGRDIPFTEKDVEKDASASAEMRAKLQSAGRRYGGVPVIDFRGTIVQGFDKNALERLATQSPPGATTI